MTSEGNASGGELDTGMKTFHEWESELMTKNEGLCLDDSKAVIGLSRLNPLPKNSSENKHLAKMPRKAKERAFLMRGDSDTQGCQSSELTLENPQILRSRARG
jgi:hypothetical protein